jgi:hypothetical protein
MKEAGFVDADEQTEMTRTAQMSRRPTLSTSPVAISEIDERADWQAAWALRRLPLTPGHLMRAFAHPTSDPYLDGRCSSVLRSPDRSFSEVLAKVTVGTGQKWGRSGLKAGRYDPAPPQCGVSSEWKQLGSLFAELETLISKAGFQFWET